MAYLIGTICGIISIYLSLFFLRQSIGIYFDHVALAMVLGGTIAVSVVSAPWHHAKELRNAIFRLLQFSRQSHAAVVEAGLTFLRDPSVIPSRGLQKNSLASEIFRDGQELISLNFKTAEIEKILEERVYQGVDRQRQASDFFLGLAKYPPAFGLVGTVLGLVNLMRAMTEGMDPKQTGIKMALALVATLYGLIMANFVIAPIGESIAKRVTIEQFHAEIALQAVLLASDQVSLLRGQEILNSFVTRKDRVNLIARLVKEAA